MSEEAADVPVVISVVIPVLNGARGLARTLDALAGQDAAPTAEILVVDNGSTDDTVAVATVHPVVTAVLHEDIRGPYAARNKGIAAARGTIIAFTDADCIPDPGWLRAGSDTIDRGAHLAGGRIRQRATGPEPSRWERYDRATYLHQQHYVTVDHFAATANLFVKASVFADIGVFLPQLVASGDVEFGQRATAKGYRLEYVDAAIVEHEPRTTLAETWRLHRKLGSGFAELAREGLRAPIWKDRSLLIPLHQAVEEVEADGPRLRYRELAPIHLTAMAGRWVGRLTGKG